MTFKQITLSSGILEGEIHNDTMIFKGVPYAKAPVGDLRWKAPQPYGSWTGVYRASGFAPAAPQPSMASHPFYGKEFYQNPNYQPAGQSEDCLYLNIWAPAEQSEKPAAVAVWLHGGAFEHGYSYEMPFSGEALARHNVILVTVGYRLGALGFLALPELADETGAVGNYGFLDQMEALRWVQNNIAAFGGDPNKVTLFGQSAGAVSVQALMSSPLAAGLFQRAILQSGGGYHNTVTRTRTKEEAYAIGEQVKRLLGVSDAGQLRSVEAQKFAVILPELRQLTDGMPFGPVIDGSFLTESLDEAVENNHLMNIPVIIGSNSEDILVEKNRDGRDGDLYRGCVSFAMGRNAPTYVYYFNHRLPGDEAGAFHSAELWYVFGTLYRSWRPMKSQDGLLSRSIISLWAHFMHTGYPSEWGWPACNDEQEIPYIRYLQ